MNLKKRELLQKHITMHTERSAEDRAAVSSLTYFLRSDGRVNTSFASDDKWPNHDGTFEFVPNPEISRKPEQLFIVQIKGTNDYSEKNGIIKYRLKSLAFPAFIAQEVTADPGILFIVLNPTSRGKERVFWKYMSPTYISTINFEQTSITVELSKDDELLNTDEGIDDFCKRMEQVVDRHLFLEKLDKDSLNRGDALNIIKFRCNEVSSIIDAVNENNELRDCMSKIIIKNSLYDLCYACIILNAIQKGYTDVNERLAWELSELSSETIFLSRFLKGIKYIGRRIPREGQSERLMLKYYNYLWSIRLLLDKEFNLNVLDNLECFPLNLDSLDEQYYEMIATCIESTDFSKNKLRSSRYYIHSQTPVFICGRRYYEINLQLAGLYASKFNRITIFSRQSLSTNYSIQIAYNESEIDLWGIRSKVKILTKWRVSINPSCLNDLGKILKRRVRISSGHNEYISLMKYLTDTGMDLLGIINLQSILFQEAYNTIFGSTMTQHFGEILKVLRRDYSNYSQYEKGAYTVRYLLQNMREEVIDGLIPKEYNNRCLSDKLNLISACYPFERNPFVSNLCGRNTEYDLYSVYEAVNDDRRFSLVYPYIRIRELTNQTGEIFHRLNEVADEESIFRFNNSLDTWERETGRYSIKVSNGMVSINSYEQDSIYILNKLLKFSNTIINVNQKKLNKKYITDNVATIDDPLKRSALMKAFTKSSLLIIYGAAGTGKTTLLNQISQMMGLSTQLFLSKTHAALQGLKRRIDNKRASFNTIDCIIRSNASLSYDLIFIDECSAIDNRTMACLLKNMVDKTKLVISGDVYQIESIEFGNWFQYAKDVITTKESVIELLSNWRTRKEELRSLWNEVREKGSLITEKLSMDGPFSDDIGENIFNSTEDDEVVLCLNYDGKFGLNNINQYFQNANHQSQAVAWADWKYKVGDRIIFNDTKRFILLFNNLKGKIIKIDKNATRIDFTIDIDAQYTEFQCKCDDIEYVESIDNKTRIKIEIIKWDESLSEEDRRKTVVPFQIAYAVSIHKAQGLEYKSVKLIIPANNADKITHSLFYTAITRAKERLRIYWSPETMETVVRKISEEKAESESLMILKKELEDNKT